MKDITHYFQVPEKNTPNISEKSSNAKKVLPKKTKNSIEKSTSKSKRKPKQSNGDSDVTLETTPSANTDENEVKEKPASGKKRKDTRVRHTKSKKPKLDESLMNVENQGVNGETPVPDENLQNSVHDLSSDGLFDERSVLENKVRKTYSINKRNIRSSNSFKNQNEENSDKPSDHQKLMESTLQMRVLLEDCMKTNQRDDISPKTNGDVNVNNGSTLKSEDSDSDSCFVSKKKSKKKPKPKSSEKCDENSPSGNNLLNYYSKVDKSQIKNDEKSPSQTVITIQAIIHSPPKDKSHHAKIKDRNSSEQLNIISSTKKKKICNFDDIKVIDTEMIDCDQIEKPKSPIKPHPNEKPSKNSTLKVQPWKMRVKLTPSSKLDNIIANGKSKKNKKIILDSSDSEQEDSKNHTNSKPTEDDDVEIVSVTTSTPVVLGKTQPVKLAPLFCKKRENIKNTSNQIRISDEAKKLFLESGVPDTLKKKLEERKKNVTEEKYNGEYKFPKFNHIQQKDLNVFVWNLKEFSEFNWKSPEEAFSFQNTFQPSPLLDRKLHQNELQECEEEKIKFDLEKEIALLKKQEPNVNVADIRSSIERLSKFNQNTENLCWTEKYNPTCFEDVIGNKGSLWKLKEWIENHKRIKQIVVDSDNSSGEEFLDSDDSCNSTDAKNNVAILVGPPGCGKTCAVYMLANELGFKVLEVNASSNRTGKRIIDELLEATQSHRVKRTSGSQSNKIDLKKVKKRKKDKEVAKDKKTMSLILIEDADILFENHDEGFLSALNSLTSLSKRPLIFVVNNLNYPHLHKYNNSRNLVLKFDYPSRSSINVWLKLIALIEGVKLTDEVLIELHKIAGSDLRKNLTQLQMLISSKLRSPRYSNEQLFHQDWLSHVTLMADTKLPAEIIDTNESNSCDKLFSDEEDCSSHHLEKETPKESIVSKSASERRKDLEALSKTVKFLNFAANLDNFKIESSYKIFPAEILHQFDRHQDYSTCQLNEDIAQFFKDTLFGEFQKSAPVSFKKYHNAVIQHSRIVSTRENVFTSFNSRIDNHVARNCDYLPVIRDIARTERSKLTNTYKRTSRYFGYLKSVNIDITDKQTKILCNTFL